MPQEYGRIGQRRFAGIFSEEFLRELQGKHGIEVHREMSENDDVCGAIIFVIEALVRQCTWTVAPGGESAKDKEAAEFVESCMTDMQDTWTDTISEILSFLPFFAEPRSWLPAGGAGVDSRFGANPGRCGGICEK